MKRKNKSIKIVKMPLYSAYNRRTTFNINSARVDQELHVMADVSDILEEIIRNVFEDLQLSCGIIEEYSQLANKLENIFQLSSTWQTPENDESFVSVCEPQPLMTSHRIGRHQQITISRRRSKQKPSLFCSNTSIKEQSKSCDFNLNLQSKYIQKHRQKKEQLKLTANNTLLPLLNLNRNSEDHSEEIQELLRRKKELQFVQFFQRQQRLNTTFSRRSNTDRKKYCFQNDDGNACDMSCNLRKGDFNKLSAGEIKYNLGETLYQGLKKKTIMEHIFVKKKKMRRQDINLGDTCVLIEQMRQTEPFIDLQLSCLSKMTKKGVKIRIQQPLDSSRDLKLPTVR